MNNSGVFVGIKFGSFSTSALVYDSSEGVRELFQGSIKSSVCLHIDQPEQIYHIGNESITCFASVHCKVSDLALFLCEDSDLEQISKYNLPYTLNDNQGKRSLNVKWMKQGRTCVWEISIDTILKKFFDTILKKTKAVTNNTNGPFHVVVGVPPYIKEKGKALLKSIFDEIFTTCRIYDSVELLSLLLQVDQIQSKTKYSMIYDIGHHHSLVAIIDNLTGYVEKHNYKMLGGADIVCSLMNQALKTNNISIEKLTFTQIDKLRSSCCKTLVSLSTLTSSVIEVELSIEGEETDLKCPCTRDELSLIVDTLYGNFFFSLRISQSTLFVWIYCYVDWNDFTCCPN